MAHTSRDFNHSKATKNNNLPLLCTGIKIAVNYSNRHFAHATSQITHITQGNNDYFCKLRALLCCAALKCICPTTLIPQTATTAPPLEPSQSSRPHWGTPAWEDSRGLFEGRQRALPCPRSLLRRQRLSTAGASNMAQHSLGHKATRQSSATGQVWPKLLHQHYNGEKQYLTFNITPFMLFNTIVIMSVLWSRSKKQHSFML